MDLVAIRQEIDQTDSELVRLIEKRMDLVSQVAAYKRETGKAILDNAREEEVLAKVSERVCNVSYRPYIVDTFADMMRHSRAYQTSVLKDR